MMNGKNDRQRAAAAQRFADRWSGKGYEKGQSQIFWTELLTQVLDVEDPSTVIAFEDQVKLDHTAFIDAYIERTHTLIEQKSMERDLRKPVQQSDGTWLTPFQQAQRYSAALPYSRRPRWIVTCNFATFLVYDMENPNGEPFEIHLADLGKEYYRLRFLVESGSEHLEREMRVSMQAGAIVGKLYDALLAQYINPDDPDTLRNLNVLCVRLVFCLYAEDAGILGRHDMFHDYMAHFDTEDMRAALIRLFQVMDTPLDQRDPYLKADLAAFPYVNGGLFHGDIVVPQFNQDIRQLLLQQASLDFDWSEISPTIFGAVFESTLNPDTRRSGGMHYTSIQNIHRVIDPLFLDSLTRELNDIMANPVTRQRRRQLLDYQERLAGLTFLDPACGSGNFLTETYLSLRRLENRVIRSLYEGEAMFIGGEFTNPVRVSIHQFYGIEINDFAVTVATTALWISEAQMLAETERIVARDIDFLPLKSYPNIAEGNALTMDWQNVIPRERLNYIMGNPPFVGAQYMTKTQKAELMQLFPNNRKAGVLDYVSGWYIKAANLMRGTNIKTAFVSTNSITQGEQVAALWKDVLNNDLHINFAYRTFRWDNDANSAAHVHCVIIGFSEGNNLVKRIYDGDENTITCENINGYLLDAPDIYISSRTKPICDVPSITKGCQPTDGGNLIIENDELKDFLDKEPKAAKFIKKLVGAREFINNKNRWCLWLVNASPAELRGMPFVMERIAKVREMRLNSSDKGTQRLAERPALFRETYNPDTFIIVPSVSSERRKYIPLGFLNSDTIATNLVLIIPNATLYHFGVLTSNVHMAWMRVVCGRLKSDYRYSKDIVYNNFPWPQVTQEQRDRIMATAQGILDARAQFPDSSLADLYDPVTMPPVLLNAHRANDRAVMAAYGFPTSTTEPQCVTALFALYHNMTHPD